MPTRMFLAVLVTANLLAQPKHETESLARFEMDGHLIVVEGSLGSVSDLHVLVDTGTSLTLIDRKLGTRLLRRGAVSPTRVEDGKPRLHVAKLNIGSQSFTNFDPILRDLGGVGSSGFDLILGIDVLRQSDLTIDYPGRQIVFSFHELSGSRTRFHPRAGLILIPVQLCSATVALMLDTGAQQMALYDHQRPDGTWDCLLRRPGRVALSFYNGKVRGRKVLWPKMTIRNMALGSQNAVLLSQRHQEAVPGQGILSPVDLGIRQLSIDFVRGVVILSR